eukprot:g12931.t1
MFSTAVCGVALGMTSAKLSKKRKEDRAHRETQLRQLLEKHKVVPVFVVHHVEHPLFEDWLAGSKTGQKYPLAAFLSEQTAKGFVTSQQDGKMAVEKVELGFGGGLGPNNSTDEIVCATNHAMDVSGIVALLKSADGVRKGSGKSGRGFREDPQKDFKKWLTEEMEAGRKAEGSAGILVTFILIHRPCSCSPEFSLTTLDWGYTTTAYSVFRLNFTDEQRHANDDLEERDLHVRRHLVSVKDVIGHASLMRKVDGPRGGNVLTTRDLLSLSLSPANLWERDFSLADMGADLAAEREILGWRPEEGEGGFGGDSGKAVPSPLLTIKSGQGGADMGEEASRSGAVDVGLGARGRTKKAASGKQEGTVSTDTPVSTLGTGLPCSEADLLEMFGDPSASKSFSEHLSTFSPTPTSPLHARHADDSPAEESTSSLQHKAYQFAQQRRLQPKILPRQHCIVFVFGQYRAVIWRNEVLLFGAEQPEVLQLLFDLKKQLLLRYKPRGHGIKTSGGRDFFNPERVNYDFEVVVLQFLLDQVCNSWERRLLFYRPILGNVSRSLEMITQSGLDLRRGCFAVVLFRVGNLGVL